ncbi:MAG: molybdopterin-synthase adenylyltransferase MoeB [Alphaproteobacteria bacterium]|nr:MAG: molybdopterin-synthase adenylyltransferase MoeB [Alphaproteobacteria bacterium]
MTGGQGETGETGGAALTPDEIERYARHIVLREFGGPGQMRLRRSSVLVVGAGGLGSPALLYLAAAGVGRIAIVDDDVVSLSNLQRQVIHDTPSVGTAKTESAAARIRAINPHVEVIGHRLRLDDANAPELIAGHDLVLDGCDNFATRYVVNRACARAAVPLVSGAIAQWEGQLTLFDPARGTPCYECIFPAPPAEGLAPTCAEAGVIGALPGVIGAMMALEAIKHLAGAGRTLAGEMLIYDGLWGESRKLALAPRADCPVCSSLRRAAG